MVSKKMLYRDTVREIKHTMGRFLSILCITALGTAFFSGIRTASPVMQRSFDDYVQKSNFMDVRFVSTVGFDEDDVNAIKSLDGITDVQATYQMDVLAEINDKNSVVTLLCWHEGDNALNKPAVVEGRLPQNKTECAVEAKYKRLKIGDTIPLKSGTDDPLSDYINSDKLTIVGKVQSPLYTSLMRGSSTLGSGSVDGYMVVHPSLFCLDVYTDVYARVGDAKALSVFSADYDNLMTPLIDRAKVFADARAATWYQDTVADAKKTLQEKQDEYDDGVRLANSKFKKAQNQLNDGKAQLQSGEAQIAAAQTELDQQKSQGLSQIQAGRAALQQGYDQYNQAYAQYLCQKDYMTVEQQQQAEADFAAQKAQLDAQKAELDANEQTLLQSIAQGQAQIDDQKAILDKNKSDLNEGQQQLDTAKHKANRKFADAREKLAEAKQDIEDIPEAKWYVMGHDANAGYMEYQQSADRIGTIAGVFPVFFFFIAALVCLTTMTRMVDEQRTNMGTLKALGYSKWDIASKYLIYAAIPSILGSAIGISVGMSLFPYAIFKAYAMMFTVPGPLLMMHYGNAALAVAIAVGVCIAATMMACYSELHDSPAALMRPRAPKAGKLILLERIGFLWKRLSFTSKVTARNLFRYKRRLFMTLIGIAGCTGLLLTGFGIRDSIKTIVENQYGKIYQFQISVSTKDDLPSSSVDTLQKDVGSTQGVVSSIAAYAKSMDFNKKGYDKKTQATLTVFADGTDASPWIRILDMRSQKIIPLPQHGAIIDTKMATELGLKVGDVLEMQEDDMRYNIPVVALCENYLHHAVYLTQAGYAEIKGSAAAMNHLYVNTATGANLNGICEQVLAMQNVSQVNAYTQSTETMSNAIKGLDGVVWVLIIAAAALAFVVMYNLTNINIGERIREIATLKVLGFTKREVAEYVFRENLLLSLLGIALGCAFGIWLHRYVMTTVEVEGMMFGRQIYPLSFGISVLLTFLFTTVVNFVMLPRLSKIDMVESLKTVE